MKEPLLRVSAINRHPEYLPRVDIGIVIETVSMPDQRRPSSVYPPILAGKNPSRYVNRSL